jgi:hypothetical protein
VRIEAEASAAVVAAVSVAVVAAVGVEASAAAVHATKTRMTATFSSSGIYEIN